MRGASLSHEALQALLSDIEAEPAKPAEPKPPPPTAPAPEQPGSIACLFFCSFLKHGNIGSQTTDIYMDGRIYMDGWLAGWIGWMDRCTDGRIDGCGHVDVGTINPQWQLQ